MFTLTFSREIPFLCHSVSSNGIYFIVDVVEDDPFFDFKDDESFSRSVQSSFK